MEATNYTKEIDLGLAKILVLANAINRKTELCCFVHDTAHCSYLEIELHKDKNSWNGTPVKHKVYYDETYGGDTDERIYHINRCIIFLEETLKSKGINYDNLYPVYEEVVKCYEL